MAFLFELSESVNPFQGLIVLSVTILILSLFAVSKNKVIKKCLTALVLFSTAAAFLLNIHSYALCGNFSGFLIFFGSVQMLEIGIIIFSAVNVLFFITMNRKTEGNFVKELILFVFMLICAEFIVISSNFLLMFTSLSIFILTVFQLVSTLNSSSGEMVTHILRFILRPTLTVIFFFSGFSMLYGAQDFKNFSQVLESGDLSNPFISISLILFGIALFLYFFLFPLQGPYIKMIKRGSSASNAVIWFLYFPVGFFLFLKLGSLYSYFIEENNIYYSAILAVAALGFMLAGNIGAVSTKSLRRMKSFLFLFFISAFLFNISMYSAGIINKGSMGLFNFLNILIILFSFMPLYGIFSSIEEDKGKDSLVSIRGLGRNNIYAGINIVIIFLSWSGLIYYLKPFMNFFNGGNFLDMGVIGIALLIFFLICFVFLAINVLRILICIYKKASGGADGEKQEKILFPKFLYVYITFFSIVIIVTPVVYLLGRMGIDIAFIDFCISEFSF
ncbi:MAG: hypothetical protein U9O59_07595 [Actinomycetota bacterium]|nr:hypothetical protein [Actinomycetota bacterium]